MSLLPDTKRISSGMEQLPNPTVIHEFTFDPRLVDHTGLEKKRIEAFRLIHVLRWKESRTPDYPLIVSLMGGTGTGKSTIFNSLVGRPLSRTGSRRPCTHRALIVLPENPSHREDDWKSLFSSLSLKTEEIADFAYHDHLHCPGSILVDTPDFDSVELSNRDIAELFFVVSDVLILVTSQEKYADMINMDMRQKALSWVKKTVLALNKVTSEAAFEDFRAQCPGEQDVVRINRIDPPPELIPGLRDHAEFRSILGFDADAPNTKTARQAEIGRLRTQCESAVADLDDALTAQYARIEDLNGRIGRIVSEVTEDMERELESPVSADLEARMRGRLQGLLQKYDLLFRFRVSVRDALTSVRDMVFGDSASASGNQQPADREWELRHEDLKAVWSGVGLQPLEHAVYRLRFEITELLARDPTLTDLRHAVSTDVKSWSPQAERQRFDATLPHVWEVLQAEVNRFKKDLSPADELRLYGSQTLLLTLWPLLVVTVDLALTGGHLTIINFLLGAAPGLPFAPFIPKWFLSREVVKLLKEIGRKIEATHRETLRTILEEQAEQYRIAFETLLPPPHIRNEVRDLRDNLARGLQ